MVTNHKQLLFVSINQRHVLVGKPIHKKILGRFVSYSPRVVSGSKPGKCVNKESNSPALLGMYLSPGEQK